MAIQERMATRSGVPPESAQSDLRIKLHANDVLVEGDDLVGDGRNIAARLYALAEPRGTCMSARVNQDAVGKITLDLENIGTPALKNVAQPIRVYRLRLGGTVRPASALSDKSSLVVLPFQNMSGDPEQEYFVARLVEDIITVLSRIGWFFIIARNSVFTYKRWTGAARPQPRSAPPPRQSHPHRDRRGMGRPLSHQSQLAAPR